MGVRVFFADAQLIGQIIPLSRAEAVAARVRPRRFHDELPMASAFRPRDCRRLHVFLLRLGIGASLE